MAFAVLVLCSFALEGASEPFREPRARRNVLRLYTAGEAKMRTRQTPAQQPQGSKRAREPDIEAPTRLDTPTASMNPDPDNGSGPSTDRIRRRLEEAWY